MNYKAKFQCEQVEEALSAYLDGETSPEEKKRVETHLQTCGKCQEMLEDLKTTKAAVKTLRRMEAPATLWKSIETGIGAPTISGGGAGKNKLTQISIYRRVSRIAAAAAAVIFFFFTSITLVGYFTGEPNMPQENIYMASHAYHVMRLPLSDHASWSYASGEAAYSFVGGEE